MTTNIFNLSTVLSVWIFEFLAFRGHAEIRQSTPNATAAAAHTPTSTQGGRNTVRSIPAPNAGKAIAAAFTRFEVPPLQQRLKQRFVSTTPFHMHYMPRTGELRMENGKWKIENEIWTLCRVEVTERRAGACSRRIKTPLTLGEVSPQGDGEGKFVGVGAHDDPKKASTTTRKRQK